MLSKLPRAQTLSAFQFKALVLAATIVSISFAHYHVAQQNEQTPRVMSLELERSADTLSNMRSDNIQLTKRAAYRKALNNYFANPYQSEHTAQEIWQIIEEVERDQQVLAFEALNLKIEWLKINIYDKTALQARTDTLISDYNNRL